MIDLRLKIEPLPIVEPLVVRLTDGAPASQHDACLVQRSEGLREYDFCGFSLVVYVSKETELDQDVLLILPGQSSAHRLIRADSRHNTFLLTEQCDQLCIMCSQPPKKHHADLFEQFLTAASLAPFGAYIGLSGGEPMLHKESVFRFLEAIVVLRPDLRFHILSNGQHFEPHDAERLNAIGLEKVLWGIPLYAAVPDLHDKIVGKSGAFSILERNLAILMRAGVSVEMRTVVMQQNWTSLPKLADYITSRAPFISVWALMQMERIGYGRMNWKSSFQDTSHDFTPLKTAVNICAARGIDVALYNFPLCSVPEPYRKFTPSTISDWKRKYLDVCGDCGSRSACGGFFEWYSHVEGFRGIAAI